MPGPVCAHLTVFWTETRHQDGGLSGRWECARCGAPFAPVGVEQPVAPLPPRRALADMPAADRLAILRGRFPWMDSAA